MTEDYSPLAQDVQKKFQDWFGAPVPTEPLLPAAADHSSHRTQRRRADSSSRLSGLFIFGFEGAAFIGTGVGFFIMFLSFWGWYSKDWLSPIFVIFLAVVIGFLGGLYKGLFYKLRRRTYYK